MYLKTNKHKTQIFEIKNETQYDITELKGIAAKFKITSGDFRWGFKQKGFCFHFRRCRFLYWPYFLGYSSHDSVEATVSVGFNTVSSDLDDKLLHFNHFL